jgi:hypothetical protein
VFLQSSFGLGTTSWQRRLRGESASDTQRSPIRLVQAQPAPLQRSGFLIAASASVGRCFPPPWTVNKIPGGFKVLDASGQSLAYVYSRETPDDAHIAGVLTDDEARRITSNIAKLPELLGGK